MEMRKLAGRTLPAVGLGCMGMSEFYGSQDDAHSLEILHKALDVGYRHFDTANMYGQGHNESLLGSFIQDLPDRREEVFIASKCGIVRHAADKFNISVRGDRDYIIAACEASLKRLKTDYIDLYYLHRLDPHVEQAESIDAMATLIRDGKIRAYGMCEASAEQIAAAHAQLPMTAVQSELSLWTRDAQAQVIPLCQASEIAFVAFSPLGRGFLSGAIDQKFVDDLDPSLDFRTRLPRFQARNLEQNQVPMQALRQIAAELGLSPAGLALRWVLETAPHIHIIPGTCKPHHLQSNFDSANLNLRADLMQRLDQIFRPEAIAGSRYPEKILQNPHHARKFGLNKTDLAPEKRTP
jgi:aryl-alcohol dehydrogenase-like predicted oxidoreductase